MVKSSLREEDKEKHIQDAANSAANSLCQMTALEWLMEWQEKQRNTKSSYFVPHDNELRGAKPLGKPSSNETYGLGTNCEGVS